MKHLLFAIVVIQIAAVFAAVVFCFLSLSVIYGVAVGSVLSSALILADLFLDSKHDKSLGSVWCRAVRWSGPRHAALRTLAAIAFTAPAVMILLFYSKRLVAVWGQLLRDTHGAAWAFIAIVGYFMLNVLVRIIRLWWLTRREDHSNA